MKTIIKLSLSVLFALGTAHTALAQGETASGTVSGVQSGGDYDYTITLNNTSSSVSIDGFWYAWVPDVFYLPSDPISVSVPAGWTASAVLNSIQYSANAGVSLAPNASISFQYVAAFSPAQLTGVAGYSYVYHTGLDSGPDTGSFLDVATVAAVPEPSSINLFATGLLGVAFAGWRKLRKSPVAS